MSQSDNDTDLSHAIRQLETLLDSQPDTDSDGGDKLPVLDEIVDADAQGPDDDFDAEFEPSSSGTSFSNAAGPDPEQIRAVLERIAGQMDTELESVVSLLKQNMLEAFKSELATALNMDPRDLDKALDNHAGRQNSES